MSLSLSLLPGPPRQPPPGAGWVPLHPTHYVRLGLAEDATPGQIADIPAPGPQTGAELRLAHAVLSDPLRRTVYDDWLARERAAAARHARRTRVFRLARLLLIGGVVATGVLALGVVLDNWQPAGGQAVEEVKAPAAAAG